MTLEQATAKWNNEIGPVMRRLREKLVSEHSRITDRKLRATSQALINSFTMLIALGPAYYHKLRK